MIGRDRNDSNDPLTALNLPAAVHAQALKLLAWIAQAETRDKCELAAELAKGFVLGLETVKALNAPSLEGLYVAFEHAETAREMELEQ